MLPAMEGLRVVDLGCGFGWFCRFAREAGAAHVLGLDGSENMLARARKTTPDSAIVYQRADLERLDFPGGSFDLAYSSLTLHYHGKPQSPLPNVDTPLAPGRPL